MLKYQDYEKDFQKLGIEEKEGIVILDYLSTLARIGIAHLNKEKNTSQNE